MASFFLLFPFYHSIFFFIRQTKLIGNDIQTIGDHGTDTITIDKNKLPVKRGDEDPIDDGNDSDPFPIARLQEEKNPFPF